MNFRIAMMTEPTSEIAEVLNRWENDPDLVPFIRPAASRDDLLKKKCVTVGTLKQRIESHDVYLIYRGDRLIGEMDLQIDPEHLARKEESSAWIGIYIGDIEYRGKGAGTYAIGRLDDIVREHHLRRIELGVFEFNTGAYRLYERLGYKEFARIDGFTWWEDRMWRDIRMEKYLD